MQGCNSKISLEKETSFSIETAHYTEWISGVKGGGSSIDIAIKLLENSSSNKSTLIKGIYFKDAYISVFEKEGLLYEGVIKNTLNNEGFESEGLGSENPEAEKKEDSSFEKFKLEPNEGILHYMENNKNKYVKILLQRKEGVGFPM